MHALLSAVQQQLTSLPRVGKRFVTLSADAAVVLFAFWAAFKLRLEHPWPPVLAEHWWLAPAVAALSLVAWYVLGLYHTVIRLLGAPAVMAVVQAAAVATAIYIALVALLQLGGIPRATYPLFFVLLVVCLGGTRYVARRLLPAPGRNGHAPTPVLIYGAGLAGVQLADTLELGGEYRPVAFLDDDAHLHGTAIKGLPVEAPARVEELVTRHGVREILLALPSTTRQRRHEIVTSLSHLPVHVRTVPGLGDIVSGRSRVDDLREVDVDDLLERAPVPPDEDLLDACIAGRRVLLTGAAGSIGSELGRQIVRRGPACLVLVEQSEAGLYAIERELNALVATVSGATRIVPVLASVLDAAQLEQVLHDERIETVYHAAAYKHVPLVEENVTTGVRNNVFGTLHTARAAISAGVKNFVLVSTDKAVNPTNVMGASKRVAEQVLQALAAAQASQSSGGRTCLSMVRFGNVLDSSGSVVPLFRRQIREGGPVTVTHPEITRYFMTIPEAAQLVLQAGSMCEGGDVFVLDMGEPVKILDLARRMIHLSGLSVRDELNPGGDIAIRFTGLRPGEKLYEELLLGTNVTGTEHPMISRAREDYLPWPKLRTHLDALELLCRDTDIDGIRELLTELVDGYGPPEAPRERRDGPGKGVVGSVH